MREVMVGEVNIGLAEAIVPLERILIEDVECIAGAQLGHQISHSHKTLLVR